MSHEKRRDRPRRPGRVAPFREIKPTILIVCEGSVTEPQYFRGLKNACRNDLVDIEIADEHGTPKTLVSIAKGLKKSAKDRARQERDKNLEYDHVWCVFDIDDHPYVPESRDMAAANGIKLAISNPSFELWLLLHFRDHPGMQDRTKVRRMLGTFLPNYHKHVDCTKCLQGYTDAVARARKLDAAAKDLRESLTNPSTSVHLLSELIRGDKPLQVS